MYTVSAITGKDHNYGACHYQGTVGSDMMASAENSMGVDTPRCGNSRTIEEVLPGAMLMEILSRLPDARDLARSAAVNRFFRSSFAQVKSVRFTCMLKNIGQGQVVTPFKDAVTATLGQLRGVEDLHLAIEDELQAKRFKEDEQDKNSLWLSEKCFVSKWLLPMSHTLQRLCIIDYGQQAIFKSSPLLQTLSKTCPNLQILELRNMFLDCQDCEPMKKMTNLTLRCLKLPETGLKDLNECMPNLEILTLVTVVGPKEAEFKSNKLKVLCLGLASKVKSVRLNVSSLIKLQLKMACPEILKIQAPSLKCLALCMGQNKILEFEQVTLLEELLVGSAEFSTLARLSGTNARLEKVFLDIPCMSFEESGGWKGVLPHVPLKIPDMEAISNSCPRLQTLSVGPGLWHSFEESMNKKDSHGEIVVRKWPTLRRLILHVIVLNADTTMDLLTALMRAMPTLNILEVYVHESSKVGAWDFFLRLKPYCPQLELKCDSWRKGLKFGCFSF